MRATYRLQLHREFTFDHAAAIADYLSALGVSHVYSSPYLQAAAGSTHGYDVVDPTRVNDELGGAPAHQRFCQRLGASRLGQVLDVVPNHMAITGPANRWWQDVLENGPSSRYAAFFDIDWAPPEARLRNTILLPTLGDHYGRVLEAGELRIQRDGDRFTLHYHEHVFPLAPGSLPLLLAPAADQCGSDELAFIAGALERLPLATATDRVNVHQRHRDKQVLHAQLARLCAAEPAVAAAIDEQVAALNADADALDTLLERQNYRLAFWRATRDLSYRRFFDVNTLVGLRVEDERVFAETHALVLQWLRAGVIDGVRIDHPDGLRDPQEYFARLHRARPQAWIIAEKILAPDEPVRATWEVDGTTGYEFLNRVGALFVDPAGEAPLTELYRDFTGEGTDFDAAMREKKHLVMREALGSDVNRLTELFLNVCERHRRHRDYTRHDLHEALREVIACFPVYRTYVRAETGEVDAEDVRWIQAAVAAAGERADLDRDLLGFLQDLLLLRVRGELESKLVMRFQQVTSPVMAKGVEDTAYYCFNRLISLNEVGGDPRRFAISVDAFHRACLDTQARWPQTMLTTSTHDTKRSEDVRARIHLLSEIPQRWAQAVHAWAAHNARHGRNGLPDRNTEYFFYQTLVGAWPLTVERAVPYMEKAAREAKAHTSWTQINAEYEAALRAFVEGTLGDADFTAQLAAFVTSLVEPGRVTSLAQTLIKLTAPGVPDLYQGTELWNLSLVDPDNRRPVDYDLRRRLLAALADITPEQVCARSDEGLPKLWVIRQALALRGRCPEHFGREAAYEPLAARGARAGHVVAFLRGGEVATIVPRLVLALGGVWGETAVELPTGTWHNEFTGDHVAGGAVSLGQLLARFPVALLSRRG